MFSVQVIGLFFIVSRYWVFKNKGIRDDVNRRIKGYEDIRRLASLVWCFTGCL